jgi:hypothetical protein
LRDKASPALVRSFEDALTRTEQWLEQFAAKQTDKDQADSTAKDRDALRQGRRGACEDFERKWQASVSALMKEADSRFNLEGLSLVDDESLDLQLAHESFTESVTRRYRAGIEALDQRLALVMGVVPMGKKMPLSADAMANAASAGIQGFDVEPVIRGLAFRHFEEALANVLPALLKDLNGWFAAAGVLPHLVVPDVEERHRGGTKSSAADDAGYDGEQVEQRVIPSTAGSGGGAPVGGGGGGGGGVDDRALFDTLVGLLQSINAKKSQAAAGGDGDMAGLAGLAGLAGGMSGGGGRAPAGRPLESMQTISVLDRLQREPSPDVLNALGSGEGSLAEVLKRQVLQGAKRLGIEKDEAHLAPAEETAVDLVGNLFDVMARDRPYGEVAKPLLGRMVMPFTKAAVMDPELFVHPEHPARKLLNTVSEACEDNLGESAQEKELLGHVASAIEQLNTEFESDLAPFEAIEKNLSGQMASHRRRVGLSERREAEAQRGQERLELARSRASESLQSALRDRSMPAAIRDFLLGSWQHHLTMVALRQPEDSPAWKEAVAIARPWLDFCDMASLGEPIPKERLQPLRPAIESAMASSGVHGQAADVVFEAMSRALVDWAEHGGELPEATAPEPATELPESRFPAASAQRLSPDVASLFSTQSDGAPAPLPLLAPGEARLAPAEALDAMLAEVVHEPPTEEELVEMRELPMNVWLQLPKSANELQVVKLSWVSGISGLMMFVNRRGARVLVASPAELVIWKRQGRLNKFDRNAPVDQAMSQVVDRLRRQATSA